MTQAEEILGSSFDIADLDKVQTPTEKLFKLAVAHDVDGNELYGFFIDSKDCKEYQDATREIRIDGLKRSSKRKSALDASTDEGAGAIAKMIEKNEVTLAMSVVKGWFGFQQGGKDVPFDKVLLAKMFATKPTWKDKVNAALEKDANFL